MYNSEVWFSLQVGHWKQGEREKKRGWKQFLVVKKYQKKMWYFIEFNANIIAQVGIVLKQCLLLFNDISIMSNIPSTFFFFFTNMNSLSIETTSFFLDSLSLSLKKKNNKTFYLLLKFPQNHSEISYFCVHFSHNFHQYFPGGSPMLS